MKKYRKRLAGAAAVLIFLFVTADVTTKAVMDESLFHMVGRWKDQIAIRPAKENIATEIAGFEEETVECFKSNEEFAEAFDGNFLVCTWLPEGMKLYRIYKRNDSEFHEILWSYCDDTLQEQKVEIWMYQSTLNDTAGYARGLGENEIKQKYLNGSKIMYYKTEEGMLAGFEYGEWCYTVDTSAGEDVLDSIIGGMTEYETVRWQKN